MIKESNMFRHPFNPRPLPSRQRVSQQLTDELLALCLAAQLDARAQGRPAPDCGCLDGETNQAETY